MITSIPAFAAAIPYDASRQAMATAPSSGPSSLISSQPTSRRSRAASQSRSCSVSQRCRYSGPGSPRFSARARAAGLASHSSRGHSSPPTCTYGLSKTSSSSVYRSKIDGHRVVGQVQHLGEDAERGRRLVAGLGVVAELGIGRQQGQHVPGELQLGHHRDPAIGGVADQGPQLVVGVEAAVRGAVGEVLEVPLGLRPPAGPLLQLRVPVGGEPPALVLGQVQVEHVVLVQRDQVDEPEQIGQRHEVPADVEVHAAPAEARLVGDPDAGHAERLAGRGGAQRRRRQQLAQGLGGPVEAAGGGGGELDALGRSPRPRTPRRPGSRP